MEKLLGQQLGPYRLESILGSGGMAVVYRARHEQGHEVALKVLVPPPGAGSDILARFEREARTAARLSHPAIVRVLDVGRADGYAYLAMPLIEGQSLADRLAASGALDEAAAADIAWQIADALYYAHSQGVVHRDVKPSNILLSRDGRAMLTDFGVARALDDVDLTRTGHTVGTPAYMAPEQATGESPVDGRADLYSLGIVLYHMIAGRPPFQGTTPQVLHAHVYSPPPPPSTVTQVSQPMEAIILRALAKDVAQRFQTGAAMAQALAGLDDRTGTLPVLIPPARPLKRRRYIWLGLIPILLVAIVAAWLAGLFNPAPATVPLAAVSPTPPASGPASRLPDSPTPTPVAPPVSLPFPAGTLLKGTGPGIFRLSAGGRLQHIYDWPTFAAFGFDEADIQTAADDILNALPRDQELTRLIQGQDQSLDWVVGGRRWRIERWQSTLSRMGYRGLPASAADDLLLAALPLAVNEPDLPGGTLLKAGGSDTYRLFAGGVLRRFNTPELLAAYGYAPEVVVEVPDEVLSLYSIGAPLTPLLRQEVTGEVFLIENGWRRPMPDGEALWALGYGVEDVSSAPVDYLDSFPLVEWTPTPAATTASAPAPPPTSTPPPSPTACPQPVDPALAAFMQDNPIRAQLNCPLATALTTPAAWEPFERGLMLWREDLNLIYVLGPDGTWISTGDTWREGDEPYDVAIVPPPGFYQPVSGFGKTWRERPGVREALGWATTEEKGFTATIQEFGGGTLWFDPARNIFVLLLNDKTYQIAGP